MGKHDIEDALEPFDLSLSFVMAHKRMFFDELSNAKDIVISFSKLLPDDQQSKVQEVIECLTTSESVIECL